MKTISNTAKQILIHQALGYKLPIFAHTPLILNSQGKKLSKRDSVTSIDDFREMGYLPEALANYMAFLGWSSKSTESEILSLKEMSKIFKLSDINKSGAKFSWEKLNWINSQYIKKMELIKLSKILQEYWASKDWKSPSQEWTFKITLLIKDSLVLLKDAIELSKPFFLFPIIQEEGKDLLRKKESLESLQHIITYYKAKNITKIDKDTAKEIINKVSSETLLKKGF